MAYMNQTISNQDKIIYLLTQKMLQLENTLTQNSNISEQKIRMLESKLKENDHLINTLNTSLSIELSANEKLRLLVTDNLQHRVYFRAALSSITTYSYNYTTLVFDHVYENAGDGYDNSSGKFRASIEGTYMFTAYSHCNATNYLHLFLKHNNITTGYSYNPHSGQGWHSAIVTAGVYLKPNDEVYVQLNMHMATYILNFQDQCSLVSWHKS